MYPDEYPAPEQHTPPDQRYFQYPNEAGSDAETFPASPPQRFPPYTPAPSYPDMTPYTPPGYTPYVPSAPTPIATPAGQGGFSWPLAATILGFTLIVAITAVVVAYAFHGNFNPGNSGVSTIPQPTVTSSVPIVGATATATSDTTSSSACAHIAGYSNTQPGPSVIPQTFATDVPFPPDTLAYLGAPFNDGPYQFQIIYTCVASLTADNVHTYYANNLPTQGWMETANFPYGGDPTRACGDSYCWVKGTSPTRYVSLEQVTAGIAGVPTPTLYQLRLGLIDN